MAVVVLVKQRRGDVRSGGELCWVSSAVVQWNTGTLEGSWVCVLDDRNICEYMCAILSGQLVCLWFCEENICKIRK